MADDNTQEKPKTSRKAAPVQVMPGVGLDAGTMNFVAARRTSRGVETRRMRDAFIDLPLDAKKMLKLQGVNYVKIDGQLIVVGDAAMEFANLFGKEARRPLQAGMVSAGELDAQKVLGVLIKKVLGDPVVEGEYCYYSIPAAPVDQDRDIVYHKGVLAQIIQECGYTPIASNEALAIIYSEAAQDGFSGIGVSMGCLTPDTHITYRRETVKGPQTLLGPVSEVQEGDYVLSRTGEFNRVQKTWTRPHEGEVYDLSFYGNPKGVSLTGNHQVWVCRNEEWQWLRTDELEEGDTLGEPVPNKHYRACNLNFTEKVTNGPKQKRSLDWSMGLGRFLGYFLADGHLGPDGKNSVWFDFGPEEQEYVDDVIGLADHYFQRSATVTKHGNAHRVQFAHQGLWTWLNRRCYSDPYFCEKTQRERRDKVFPLRVENLNSSTVEGIVVGLFRGDGTVGDKQCAFGNSSLSLIAGCHLLLRSMGLVGTVNRRDPRDTTFSDGRVILAERCKDEWTINVAGRDGEFLRSLLDSSIESRAQKVWRDGGMVCTKLRSIKVRDYSGPVHDLTVENDPSFTAPGIVLHNSGMSNVALAINTVEGLSFSVARGGDSIDGGAAKAVGSTAARICSIKEKGVDLMNPEGRDQEALAFYYRAHIDYVLDNFLEQFLKIKNQFAIPKAIPIVVGGGTSLAGGFLELFTEAFEAKRKRFPIEISEVRAASEPLNAVAQGLLIQALQEYDDDDDDE